jgi:ribosomal protein S5
LTPQTGIIAGGALAAVLAVIGVVTNLPDVDAL